MEVFSFQIGGRNLEVWIGSLKLWDVCEIFLIAEWVNGDNETWLSSDWHYRFYGHSPHVFCVPRRVLIWGQLNLEENEDLLSLRRDVRIGILICCFGWSVVLYFHDPVILFRFGLDGLHWIGRCALYVCLSASRPSWNTRPDQTKLRKTDEENLHPSCLGFTLWRAERRGKLRKCE